MSIWQKILLTLVFFLNKIVQFFTVVIGQRMNSIKTIWSHCREVMIFHLKTPGANVVNKF